MSLRDVTEQLGTHLPQADDVLRWIGLQQRRAAQDASLALLAAFALGTLVGGTVALLFAPRPGRELRAELGERLSSASDQVKDRLAASEAPSEAPSDLHA